MDMRHRVRFVACHVGSWQLMQAVALLWARTRKGPACQLYPAIPGIPCALAVIQTRDLGGHLLLQRARQPGTARTGIGGSGRSSWGVKKGWSSAWPQGKPSQQGRRHIYFLAPSQERKPVRSTGYFGSALLAALASWFHFLSNVATTFLAPPKKHELSRSTKLCPGRRLHKKGFYFGTQPASQRSAPPPVLLPSFC